MSYTCTRAGAAFEAMAVLSFASRSSYVPWKIASTLILLWLLLNPATILLSASPLTPDIACHQVSVAAGATSFAGASALMSAGAPLGAVPPVGVVPPQAAAAIVNARASVVSLRIFPSCVLALDRPGGEASDQLTLTQHEQGERRYGDHDDTGHDQAPAERFLEAQLRDPYLRRAHECLVRDEQRPEVLVVGRQEAVDRDGAQCRPRQRDHGRDEEAECRRAVNPRRIPELTRDLHESLPEEERAEGRGHERDGQSLVCIEPSDRPDGDVVRDDRGLPRDHQRAEEQEEQQLPSAEHEERERVGREARGEKLADHHGR